MKNDFGLKRIDLSEEITQVAPFPKRTVSGTQMRAVSNPDLTSVDDEINLDEIDELDFEALGITDDDTVELITEKSILVEESVFTIEIGQSSKLNMLNIEQLLKNEFAGTAEHKQVQSIINKWTYDNLTQRAKAQYSAARYIVRSLRKEKIRRTISLDVLAHALSEVVALRRQAKAFLAFRNKTHAMNVR